MNEGEGIHLKKFKIKRLEKMRMDPNMGPPTITVIGKRNSGKCLGKDTPIIMFGGSIKKVQEIVPGDLLMGPDSKPRAVQSITRGRDLLYNVNQTHGMNYVVNSKHIMTVMNKKNEIVDVPIIEVFRNQQEYRGVKSDPINFRLQKAREPYRTGRTCKKILWNYVYNSLETRLKYFYGLADIHCVQVINAPYKHFIFKKEAKKEIIDGICFIASSLGYRVEDMCIYPEGNNGRLRDYDIHIQKYRYGEYYGFELSGDGRFLLGDFTITHNTTIIKDLMFSLRRIPSGVVMSGSAGGRDTISEIFPSSFMYNDLDLEVVDKVLKEQQKLREKHGRDLSKFDYSTAIVCDDCSFDPQTLNKTTMKELIYNGRHAKTLFIYSMQYCMNMKPDLRGNMDFVFVCREPNLDIRKKLHKYYFGIIPKFSDFCQIMDKCTENYGCLVFDNTVRSNNIEDCIYWYRARHPVPPFHFGSKSFWSYHKELQKKEPEKVKKKKDTTIIINKTE